MTKCLHDLPRLSMPSLLSFSQKVPPSAARPSDEEITCPSPSVTTDEEMTDAVEVIDQHSSLNSILKLVSADNVVR